MLRFAALFASVALSSSAQTKPRALAILEANCLRCHNASARMSGLSLATSADLLKGGAHGPVIVAGKPDDSPLYRMISGDKPKMPANANPLTASDTASVAAWIRDGAKWPDGLQLGAEVWWSLRPLRKPQPPQGASPIDAFIQAERSKRELRPSPPADRASLIRRLTFDLHGLPPAWEEIRAFVSDPAPDAYQLLVDRLLASPRYGERWARHWLDVVHYGESHGYDKDKPRRNAWHYRDYVIRSFNQDKPYTRFVEEQLAGDYLWPDSAEALIATGFIAAGPWDFVGHAELRENTIDKNITRNLDRDDMVMTAMSSFTSITAHCARCHNHKFDPIPQEDYYKLQAVFAGVDRADRPFDRDPKVFAERRALLARRRDVMSQLRPLREKAAAVSSTELTALDAMLRDIKDDFNETRKRELQPIIAKMNAERKALADSLVDPVVQGEINRLNAELRPIDAAIAKLPKPEMVYSAATFFDPQGTFTYAILPRPIHVLQRGSVENPGKAVSVGALSLVSTLNSVFGIDDQQPEGARRAALARWITSPDNMLTWRSIVNRVWQSHFGTGLVDSANDFGRMGALPSHPELLDWLAVDFRDSGGSLKRLHKQIVMSAVYRQSSANNAANAAIDGDNRYLWRMNRTRLDAESVRDATLVVSGRIDLTMGGPAVEQFYFKDDHSPVYDYTRFDVDSAAARRRSIYRFLVRSAPDPFMDRLDCPDSSLITGKRNTTITAIQALALLNNPFMVRQAEHLSARLRERATNIHGQVQWLYRYALGRDPKPAEVARLAAYANANGIENAARAMLNSNEFLFVD
ncbi:MAG: PSD1 domain-containing protein [Acidobacteria bacterium]|nr:PSD1 domain-containing protein [Acidobacteriota bacterium]